MKKRKYNNTKLEYMGCVFDSKKEYKRYLVLEEMERKGKITDLRRQVPYVLVDKQRSPDGKAVREIKYIADFTYYQGKEFVVEDVKGYRNGTAYNVFKMKKKMLLHRYGIWIKEV